MPAAKKDTAKDDLTAVEHIEEAFRLTGFTHATPAARAGHLRTARWHLSQALASLKDEA